MIRHNLDAEELMAVNAESLEARSLELLSRMQTELHDALSGLAGGQREGLYDGSLLAGISCYS
jgi:hypothetical protein